MLQFKHILNVYYRLHVIVIVDTIDLLIDLLFTDYTIYRIYIYNILINTNLLSIVDYCNYIL